jgi:hypothetical protein
MADDSDALPLHEFCCHYNEFCCHYKDSNEFARTLRFLVDRGGVATLAACKRGGALPLHVLCAASSTTTDPPIQAVRYLIQAFPGSLAVRANAGQYPFMIAASNASSGSLSVVYEMVRANPLLAVPR